MDEKQNIAWSRIIAITAGLAITGLVVGEIDKSGDKIRIQPNDPLFSKQQVLFDRINVFEAWNTTKGDPNILVGVIESGFDYFHPDLKGCLLPGFYASGGYHTEFFENVAHGTVVASIIVAQDNNKAGMVGLAPHCRVLTASHGMIEHKLGRLQKKFRQDHPEAGPKEFSKVMRKYRDELKNFSTDWVRYINLSIAEAIRYLVDRRVKVINISAFLKRSLCPPETWERLEDSFTYAAEKGVIIVLAAGNNAAMCEDYPGSQDSVIVVGSTLLNDTRWEEELDIKGTKIKQGANFGKRLTVMAPTESLQVCMPHDKRFYTSEDGPMGPTKIEFNGMYEIFPEGATSSSAPIVTSLVALVYSVRPDLDTKSVVNIIKQGCDDIGDKGYDIYTGYGRINFGKTIEIALAWKT
ncbi:MAG: S8 family peptidase [Planctomycetota bacterium]